MQYREGGWIVDTVIGWVAGEKAGTMVGRVGWGLAGMMVGWVGRWVVAVAVDWAELTVARWMLVLVVLRSLEG